jgi:hypothetical protein
MSPEAQMVLALPGAMAGIGWVIVTRFSRVLSGGSLAGQSHCTAASTVDGESSLQEIVMPMPTATPPQIRIIFFMVHSLSEYVNEFANLSGSSRYHPDTDIDLETKNDALSNVTDIESMLCLSL